MINQQAIREEFLRDLPRELEELVEACSVLPSVPNDGSAGPFTDSLYFKAAEARLKVEGLLQQRQERIDHLKEAIETERQTSTEPWWAREEDHWAGTERFGEYCQDVRAKEKEIEDNIRKLKDQIATIRVEMQVIEEFLDKAAQKKFPRTPLDEFGRKPGEKVEYDARKWRDKKVKRFLEEG